MRRWLFALFILTFIGAGVDGWRLLNLDAYLRDEPAGLLRALNPDATSDAYIGDLLAAEGVPREAIRSPSQSIRSALATLPREGAVIVVVPHDVPKYNVMFLTLKHLSLPRYAYYLPCDNPAMASIPSDEKIAAIISYLVEPPTVVSGHWRVLPRLALTATSEADAWKPYCSR